MPKGRKIDITDYDYIGSGPVVKKKDGITQMDASGNPLVEIDEVTGEAKTEVKTIRVPMVERLTVMVLNPNMGGNDQRGDPDFDVYELGTVCREIDKAYYMGATSVTLGEAGYEKLKKRVVKICKSVGKLYYEMVRRVIEAEEVTLEEAPKKLDA